MSLVILTYHRLVATCASGRNFYDVPIGELASHLDALRARGLTPLDPQLLPEAGKPGYLLTFDDGTADHFDAVQPLLEARGERGIFFVPTAKIGERDRLTREQVRALADAGHAIGCHSHEHIRLDVLSESEVRHQLATAVTVLREITGRDTLWFAPPGGFTNAAVRAVAAELGLRAIRTMRWGRNDTCRLDRLECLPLSRSFTLERFGKVLDGRGLAWLKALYLGKQALKALVPLRVYESARRALFPRRGA